MPNRLRVARAERRLSQRELARRAGIEVTRLWRIENDYADATTEERKLIASALETGEPQLWPGISKTAEARAS
jgi:transcriptional regulator with XRE-family HTH domain